MTPAKTAATTREFSFTEQDFDRICQLIHRYAGISLSRAKQEMVYSRLAKRVRSHRLKSFGEYLVLLEKSGDAEKESFINSLTTNLTSFFREEHHFPLLAEHLRSIRGSRTIMLWCSAASTGEEAYSMAMTAAEVFGTLNPPVQILASDVDTAVLEKARQGIYTQDQVDKVDEDKLTRYFLKAADGNWQIRPELKKMITFRRLNLLDDNWSIQSPFDAIFCRNVMIYFDKPTQMKILKKFVPLLRPDALLFAGHSESFHHSSGDFKLRGKTVYQLADKATGFRGN